MTSPLLPHARALLAAATPGRNAKRGCPDLDPNWPGPDGRPRGPVSCVTYPNCTCGNVDRAHGRKALIAAAPTLLASLCTALEASEAEAGRLREERESFGQSIDMLIVARDEAAKRIEAERDKLRALLAEACDIGERIERDSGNWRPTDRTRLATIRTEALK
jgi:hypothetical protein